MPLIIYIDSQGNKTEVEVAAGLTVMHGAVTNNVPGILAECGGALTCATCHCYIEPSWMNKTGIARGKEQQKLSRVNKPTTNSRLSCQIIVSEDLHGLIVKLPESQVWSSH